MLTYLYRPHRVLGLRVHWVVSFGGACRPASPAYVDLPNIPVFRTALIGLVEHTRRQRRAPSTLPARTKHHRRSHVDCRSNCAIITASPVRRCTNHMCGGWHSKPGSVGVWHDSRIELLLHERHQRRGPNTRTGSCSICESKIKRSSGSELCFVLVL